MMKLKRPRRPQNLFLYDPDFRNRRVDEDQSDELAKSAKGAAFDGENIRKC